MYIYAGSEDGSKTKDPYGKREAQQKHHSEGERGEDPGKTVVCLLYERKCTMLGPFMYELVLMCMIWGYRVSFRGRHQFSRWCFISTSYEASESLMLHRIIFSIGDHLKLGLIRMQSKRAIVLHNHNLLNKLYESINVMQRFRLLPWPQMYKLMTDAQN